MAQASEKLRTAACRTAAFFDCWHWIFLILAAPLLLFPSPARTPALLVISGLWIITWLTRREPLTCTPFNGPLLLLSVMVLVSLYATYDIAVSLPKIAGMVLGIGVFYAFAREGRHPRGWWLCCWVFMGIGIGIAGLGLLGTRWIAKVGALTPVISRLPSALVNLPGASEGLHPNEVAGALLWVMPVLASFLQLAWIRARGGRAVWVWFLALALTLFVTGVFALTQSRGGYIAFAVTGLVLVLIMLPPRARQLTVAALAILAVVALVVVARVGPNAALHRLLGGSRSADLALSLDTLEGRVEVWSRALYAIQDFPLTGMGMNTFRHIVPVLYPLFLVGPDFDIAHAHNEFLQAALDLGLPGLVAFLALYIGAFWMLAEIWRIADGRRQVSDGESSALMLCTPQTLRALVLGLGGGLFAHLIYGMTDAVALGAKPGVLFWMLLGLIAGLFDQARRNHQVQDVIPVLLDKSPRA